MYQDKAPAVWTTQEHFSVSDKGCIKPSGDAYKGRVSFMNLDTAEHILNNADSFRKAIELARSKELNKVANKELVKMQALFIRQGLTPQQAADAVTAILANAKKTA